MEKCVICGDDQDYKQYEGYNICTACADIMEDVMGEYFMKTVQDASKPKAHEGYLHYLDNTTRYVSDYKKITSKSHKYTKDVSERADDAIQESKTPSKQRYFERMHEVLDWLEKTPQFYHYYFKEHYMCPSCGSSIFEKYESEEVGEWLVISCSNCGAMIKKYFSPKLV
ncbi:MAG: hypothetical protein GKC08_03665 [Methanosarcinales archaeon]|nr:hypothetical protein [Methanosarcinales archaeon]